VQNVAIFSGQANRPLAEAICRHLGVPLRPTTFRRFGNDCQYVQLAANCREQDVYVIQPLTPPVQEHLVELMMMLDAARGASARRLTAVMPYYAYARSDKKDAPRISIAARLVADLLETAGASRALTMTLHSEQVHGFFPVPVDHLNALHILARHFQGRDLEGAVVVSPDLGHAKPAGAFARMLGLPVASGRKTRISDREVAIDMIVGDVAGKDAILMDDEIANGGSMMELMARLREHGARRFTVVCTHGLFTNGALERIAAEEDVIEVVTTDTCPNVARHPKLRVLTIAPLMAEAIRRINEGHSVSELFPA
jgi:ribose-phosphate pyrophosphokinase